MQTATAGSKKVLARKTNLQGRPQLKGRVLRLYRLQPKKPNSANRQVTRVRLSTGKLIIAKVMGEDINGLDKNKKVLIRSGRVRDLPGVRNLIIRGKF